MNKTRYIIVMAILIAVIGISYGLPRAKYTSPKIVSKLNLPYRIYSWYGRDFSKSFNPNDLRYNFISEVFAQLYTRFDDRVLLLILDAGNFHNPKACFRGSGFAVTDLPDTEFKAGKKRFKAKTLFFEKPGESYVVIYWLCIDKKITDWTGQKIKEFIFAVLNKQKTGLMIRLEIPAAKDGTDAAIKLAKEFISDLSDKLNEEQSDYLFGK
ncbi:MAG: exosortase C-terminal domain/associated protein EpsI [Candidatus Omnitrophota bacterium]